MTLAFSTHMNGHPTYFIEKIYESLLRKNFCDVNVGSKDYLHYQSAYLKQFGVYWDGSGYKTHDIVNPKSHSIREDASNRWRVGMDIHFVINNRTKNRFQFAPVVKCVSVQEIEITDISHLTFGCVYGILIDYPTSDPGCIFRLLRSVRVGGKELLEAEIMKLAINDGFDSVEDFFAYFDKDFKGKIIHWTELKY